MKITIELQEDQYADLLRIIAKVNSGSQKCKWSLDDALDISLVEGIDILNQRYKVSIPKKRMTSEEFTESMNYSLKRMKIK